MEAARFERIAAPLPATPRTFVFVQGDSDRELFRRARRLAGARAR
ncbi:hypothetical protein [Anaeromyxobacter oryzisoli]|nr:hypothetical protein [Anaeromyxobacter sp. SG63]